jgi:hypothetical protein
VRTRRGPARGEAGTALVLALCFTALLLALASGLALVASAERAIAASYNGSLEAQYAAEAAAAVAVGELSAVDDWNAVLDGSVVSSAVDGPPGGARLLSDASPLNLDAVVNLADCGTTSPCSASDIAAVTAEPPWGANNPRWRLFAFGNLSDLLSLTSARSRQYVVALVGDDGRENDGDAARDGSTAANPGCGIVNVLAESFGPRGAHATVAVTVGRGCDDMVSGSAARVLSWREIP